MLLEYEKGQSKRPQYSPVSSFLILLCYTDLCFTKLYQNMWKLFRLSLYNLENEHLLSVGARAGRRYKMKQ